MEGGLETLSNVDTPLVEWRCSVSWIPSHRSHVHKHHKHQHLLLPARDGDEEEPVPCLTVFDCVQCIDPGVGGGGGCGQVCGGLVTLVI